MKPELAALDFEVLILSSSLLLASCTDKSKSSVDNELRNQSQTKAIVRAPAVLTPTGANTNGTSSAIGSSLREWLRESPVTEVDRLALAAAMAKNEVCRKALEESDGKLDDGRISELDAKRIYEIAGTNTGFVHSFGADSVLKYGKFTEVIIYGGVNGHAFNVYLVRFPNTDWIQVDAKQVPGLQRGPLH